MRQSQILDYIGSEGGHRNGIIRLEYSPYAKNHVRRIGENGINDQAVKRRYEEGISIDGVESLDLDDAIWAEKTRS